MIASSTGVLFTFPGTLIDKSFDPTQSRWFVCLNSSRNKINFFCNKFLYANNRFRGAMKQDGKISFTSPYLDVGGAGYIISLSRSLSTSK